VTDNQQIIKDVVDKINGKLGSGAVIGGGGQGLQKLPRTSTGILSLDLALGGGYPVGKVIELFGPESSGKTTIGAHALKVIQSIPDYGLGAIVDVEHAVDPTWFENIGIDMGQLIVSQPDSAEQAFDIVESLIRSGAVRLILLDSVAALVPKNEIEGEYGDAHMGLRARLMGQFLRKITPLASKHNCTVICMNQTREKIGVIFGSNETTPGGKALKFGASCRIRVSGSKKVTDANDNVVGKSTNIFVPKNKVGKPFVKTDFRIVAMEDLAVYGVDIVRDVFFAGLWIGLIKKSGNTYTYDGTKLGIGRDKAVEGFRKLGIHDKVYFNSLIERYGAEVVALIKGVGYAYKG